MKTKAAVLWGLNEPWSVEEIELGDPVAEEVRVKLAASGLCHSDEHIVTGDIPNYLPVVGGHEGAGVVDAVGADVVRVKPGDHVVLSFIPSCGKCRWCATGHQNLCDLGAAINQGPSVADGTFRRTARGKETAAMCQIGTFSPYVVCHEASVVKIDDDIPLDKAALVGCGVTTGWGSAVYAADVQAGETVVVVGIGGVGINAVQGASLAGARHVIAVDPVEYKREQAKLRGATHVAPDADAALAIVRDLTWGAMADKAIITTDVARGSLIAPVMSLVGKTGRVVVTAIAPASQSQVDLSLIELTLFQKELRGALFGASNPQADIPKLLRLYRDGLLKLDELVTRTYPLEDINQGYQDMRDGINVRGVVLYD
jgi:S-(hydroxymethyl)glutathione dehydrogenase/alcohol dehydrogenase